MNLTDIFEKYKRGELDLPEALQMVSNHGIEEMGFATIDTDRLQRTGFPEVIYAAGKTVEQVKLIAQRMYQNKIDVLATRATPEMYLAVKEVIPKADYNEIAKTITYKHQVSLCRLFHIA